MDCSSAADVLPNPPFEGSEKRIEVVFNMQQDTPAGGLRALSREQLDELMTLAHCTIVSSRSNADFDAYVLSESSLFVYPDRWILKTCGTTRLLNSVPRLLEVTATLGLAPRHCKFTRASFLFPENQHFPHTGFEDEVAFLDKYFGNLCPNGSQAYILGQEFHGLDWHVYVSGKPLPLGCKATYNLEVCMTELGEEAARQFYRTEAFISTERTTKDTGIVNLKPGAIIDDYVFEPCGYSMNGIDRTGLMTIHVTPEPGHSYASIEISGHEDDLVDPASLLAQAVKIFNPGKIALALTTDSAEPASWGEVVEFPMGYACQGAATQMLEPGRGIVTYYTLSNVGGGKAAPVVPSSPTTVLHHAASYLSVAASSGSDSEGEAEARALAAAAIASPATA